MSGFLLFCGLKTVLFFFVVFDLGGDITDIAFIAGEKIYAREIAFHATQTFAGVIHIEPFFLRHDELGAAF